MAMTDRCGDEPRVSSSAMLPSTGFEDGIGRKLGIGGQVDREAEEGVGVAVVGEQALVGIMLCGLAWPLDCAAGWSAAPP